MVRLKKSGEPRLAADVDVGGHPVHIVTTETIPGFRIVEVKGFVWGSTVRCKFFGKDLIAALRILVGGEIREYTEMLNEARAYVMQRLAENARIVGANAVIGTKLSTAIVVPGAVEIFAYGTAVVVKK